MKIDSHPKLDNYIIGDAFCIIAACLLPLDLAQMIHVVNKLGDFLGLIVQILLQY
jgi:hypothetical protein